MEFRSMELRIKYITPLEYCGYKYEHDVYYPRHLKDAIRLICGKKIYDETFDIMVEIGNNEEVLTLDDEPIKILEHKNGVWSILISDTLFKYNEQTDYVFLG